MTSYDFRAWCYNYEFELEQMYQIVNRYKGKYFKEINSINFAIYIYENSSKKFNPYIR